MRATGMKNGVLSHHLGALEKAGSVLVVRGPRQSRFYPPSFSEQESKIIKALRRATPKLIIQSLVLNEPLAFKDIVYHVRKSPSTVSLYLSELVDDGIVAIMLAERVRTYGLKDRATIDRLVDDYRPGLLDRPVSGLEDIISSL